MSVISGLSRGFSTCCLRFKNGVATIHAKLASGWLARLYREGVEPSGSQQKVSDHIFIPLSWTYPGATAMNSRRLHWITSSAVANSVSGTVRPSALAVLRLMTNSNLVGAAPAGRPASRP